MQIFSPAAAAAAIDCSTITEKKSIENVRLAFFFLLFHPIFNVRAIRIGLEAKLSIMSRMELLYDLDCLKKNEKPQKEVHFFFYDSQRNCFRAVLGMSSKAAGKRPAQVVRARYNVDAFKQTLMAVNEERKKSRK